MATKVRMVARVAGVYLWKPQSILEHLEYYVQHSNPAAAAETKRISNVRERIIQLHKLMHTTGVDHGLIVWREPKRTRKRKSGYRTFLKAVGIGKFLLTKKARDRRAALERQADALKARLRKAVQKPPKLQGRVFNVRHGADPEWQ